MSSTSVSSIRKLLASPASSLISRRSFLSRPMSVAVTEISPSIASISPVFSTLATSVATPAIDPPVIKVLSTE